MVVLLVPFVPVFLTLVSRHIVWDDVHELSARLDMQTHATTFGLAAMTRHCHTTTATQISVSKRGETLQDHMGYESKARCLRQGAGSPRGYEGCHSNTS